MPEASSRHRRSVTFPLLSRPCPFTAVEGMRPRQKEETPTQNL